MAQKLSTTGQPKDDPYQGSNVPQAGPPSASTGNNNMAQDTTPQRNNAANGQQNTEQIKSGYESFSAPADASTNPYLDADKAQLAGQAAAVQGQTAATTGGAASQAAVTNANAASSQAAQANANQQGENSQMALISQLQKQAAGTGPSMANIQAQNALNTGLSQQMALAASSRGGNAGNALRQAEIGQAQAIGGAANQAAQTTIAEQQQGINNLGAVSGQVAGEDINQAQYNASNQQQTNLTNAANQQQVGLANAGAANQSALQNQNIQQTNNQFNATQTQNQQQYADTMVAQLQAQGYSLDQAQAAANQQQAQFNVNSAAQQEAGAFTAGTAAQNATTSQIGTIGTLAVNGLNTLSDKRQKKNINKGSKDVDAFLNHLKAKTYLYKDEDEYGHGPQLGVMAQDLEKSSLGKQMVKEDENGMKMVDYGKGINSMMASISMLHKKLKELESKKS